MSNSWRRELHAPLDVKWLDRDDLPGSHWVSTHTQRSAGDIPVEDEDVVSSDDDRSSQEIESHIDEDDDVDDLLERFDVDEVERDATVATDRGGEGNSEEDQDVIEGEWHRNHIQITNTDMDYVIYEVGDVIWRDPESCVVPPSVVACTCDGYWCLEDDIATVATTTKWINGRAISVYAQCVAEECGANCHADHLSPLILVTVTEYQRAVEDGNEISIEGLYKSFTHSLGKVRLPSSIINVP